MVGQSLKLYRYVGGTGVAAALVSLALGLSATESQAASIYITPAGETTVVLVGGPLLPDDGEKFRARTSALSKAVVMFWSSGGSVVAGVEIGEAIRIKGFTTLVTYRCASACALAWLGGAQRYMTTSARLGFHAASDSRSGEVTSVGNAVIGAYLSKLNLSYEAVIYITSAPPASMTWLTMAEAKQYKIDVTLFEPPESGVVLSETVKQNDVEAAWGIVQRERLNFNAYQFLAAVALANGDVETATKCATRAVTFVHDDTKVEFKPVGSGVTATATKPGSDKPFQTTQLTLPQFKEWLRGYAGQ
jgi:hypothetical protein